MQCDAEGFFTMPKPPMSFLPNITMPASPFAGDFALQVTAYTPARTGQLEHNLIRHHLDIHHLSHNMLLFRHVPRQMPLLTQC